MPTTLILSEEEQRVLDRLLQSGRFEDEHDALLCGLQTLLSEADQIEHLLRTEGVEAYKEAKAHPERSTPAKEVFAQIRAKHSGSASRG